jgi:hypothetical protein
MEDQSNQPQDDAEVVQLDERETMLILSYGMIRKHAANVLTQEEMADVMACRKKLYQLMKEGGDAAKIALQFFTLEFDNSELPYGDRFAQMEMIPFDEALIFWQKGFMEMVPLDEANTFWKKGFADKGSE